MGNKIARTTQVSATEYYLHDLPSTYNLVLVEILGRGRFFKSILCKHDEGLVLVKVYFKRGDPLDLKEYERRLAQIRDIFQSMQHPHVWPFQVLRVASGENEAETSNVTRALARPSSKQSSKPDGKRGTSSKYRTDELNEPAPRLQGIRSLLPLPGGDLLTGGTDLRIRYWDHSSPDHSYCVCGPSTKGVRNDEYYDIRSSFGIQVVQEMNKRPAASKLAQKALLSMAATDSAGCHRDSVLSLASAKLSQRLLISSSRDGAIKVWK